MHPRSRGPASADRRPRPWPRNGAVRSDASPRRYCHIGALQRWRATVCSRGEQPGPRYELTTLGGEATPSGGMADDVPPGQRDPRSVHQRELMGAARPQRGSSRTCAAPTRGSTSSSPPTPTAPRRSSAHWPTSSWCTATRTGRSSARSAWRSCRPSSSSASTARVQASAEGWDPAAWRAVAEQIATTTGWISPTIPVAGDRAVSRHTSTRLSAWRCPQQLDDLPVVDVLRRTGCALEQHGAALLVAPPGAGKTTVAPLWLLEQAVARPAAIVMLEPRRLATRAAAQRMAALARSEVGGARRLPDPRRTPHRPGDTDRGRHRGRAHPAPAARPRAARRRAGDLRRGARAQRADRPRPGVRTRRPRPPCGRICACWRCRRHRMSPSCAAVLGDAPIVESDGRSFPVDVRWLPMMKGTRIEQATGDGGAAGAATRRWATCWCSCPGIGEIRRVEQLLADRVGPERRRASAGRRVVAWPSRTWR